MNLSVHAALFLVWQKLQSMSLSQGYPSVMVTVLCSVLPSSTTPAPSHHMADSLCSRSDHGLPVSPAVSQDAIAFSNIASGFLTSDAFSSPFSFLNILR